jgi:hypothetical protein
MGRRRSDFSPLPRSMMAQPAARQPRSAASVYRSSGTGCYRSALSSPCSVNSAWCRGGPTAGGRCWVRMQECCAFVIVPAGAESTDDVRWFLQPFMWRKFSVPRSQITDLHGAFPFIERTSGRVLFEMGVVVWSKYWSEASISSIANLIALITVPVPHRRPG